MKIINIENPKEGEDVFIDGSRWAVLYNNCSGNKKYLVQNKNVIRFIDKIDVEVITIEEDYDIIKSYFKEGDFVTVEYPDFDGISAYTLIYSKVYEVCNFYIVYKKCLYQVFPRTIPQKYYLASESCNLCVNIPNATLRISTLEEIKLLNSYEINSK